jgi:hypothetical protein
MARNGFSFSVAASCVIWIPAFAGMTSKREGPSVILQEAKRRPGIRKSGIHCPTPNNSPEIAKKTSDPPDTTIVIA